jgi:hypothetical protein
MAILVTIILIVELYLIVFDTVDARITQGDAVTIATQIVYHRLGVGKTRLGIDDPVGGHESIEQGSDDVELMDIIELTALDSLAQTADEATADMP